MTPQQRVLDGAAFQDMGTALEGAPVRRRDELHAAEQAPGPADADVPDEVAAAAERALGAAVLLWNRASRDLEVSLSPIQLHAIEVIARHGGINLRGLAAELDAIPSSASRLCDRMEAAGLIVREGARHDRREILLRLSAEGRRLSVDLSRRRRSVVARALAEMPPAARRALIDTLTEFSRIGERPDLTEPGLAEPRPLDTRTA